MVKIIPPLCFAIILAISGYAQNIDSTTLTIRGGYGKFGQTIMRDSESVDGNTQDNFTKVYKHYQLLFKVNKLGNIEDDIFINTLSDTLLEPALVETIKKSQGMWTIHSGQDVVAVLNVYFAFNVNERTDSTTYANQPRLTFNHYKNWESGKYVYLEPVYISKSPYVR